MSAERLLRTREVAEMLDLSMSTVLAKFERGELPGYRLGKKGGPIRFRESEILAWLETRHVGPRLSIPPTDPRPLWAVR